MQLYAHNVEGQLIFVDIAVKQIDYYCRECQGVVRLRSGLHRHRHFYHLQPVQSCSGSGKSLTHLQVQYHLANLLPPGECQLEYQFPTIGRIADVAWLPRKVIFEVQCSGISAAEIRQRNADYTAVGFQVIWILHDSRFNQKRLSAAEDALKTHMHYFTNLDESGEGTIYDQFSLMNRGIRETSLRPLPIDIPHLRAMRSGTAVESSSIIQMRCHSWPFYCAGDLVDGYLSGGQNDYLDQIALLEGPLKTVKQPRGWWRRVIYFYRIFFQMLLENACR
jgi:competence protein CoiA